MMCIVPQGYVYIIENLGKYARTAHPGLSFILPFLERVARKVNVMEQVLEIPQQNAITKDNVVASIDGIASFQIFDPVSATYEVSNLDISLITVIMTNLRTVVGAMDLDQLLSNRDEISARVLKTVDAAASPWGVKVIRIEIKDIVPPREMIDSMARQMKAERERRALILEAEGERQAKILRAEAEKEAQILAADGRRESAFRDAEARERQAEAESVAVTTLSQALSNGNIAAINYMLGEKYVSSIKELATSQNQKTLIVPMDLSSLAGTLGGVSEIVTSTFKGTKLHDKKHS
jgi:regulator of protease activity HflC (stomatin/prohibitin superfamily)